MCSSKMSGLWNSTVMSKLLYAMLPGLLCVLCLSSAAETWQHTLTVAAQDGEVLLTENEKPVLRYRYADVPRKPYLLEWFASGGENILRDAPADHLHHHGLMFAITVDDVNFWEEYETGGYQVHKGITKTWTISGTESPSAGFNELLEWRGPANNTPYLREERRLVHHAQPNAPYRLLTWQSTLSTTNDRPEVILSGTVYHGLGMRFTEWMDGGEDREPVFLLAPDVTEEWEEDTIHRFAKASWVAYTVEGPQGQQRIVAMFNNPDNPRPATWFMMVAPFGYLSATIDLGRDPLPLGNGETLRLRYGVAVWDDAVDAATIESAYADWQAQLPEVLPEE